MTTPARPVYFLSDFTDAAAAFGKVSTHLQRGLSEPRHPCRTLTVATNGPSARTVVLRAFDPMHRVAWFHTDRRSPKFGELTADPRVCLLWYDPDARLQVRMPATAILHTGDAEARAAWQSLAETSKRDYAALTGPGGDLTADDGEDPAAAERHFVAVACQFDSLDLLELHVTGHRRALLTWDNTWHIKRLAP